MPRFNPRGRAGTESRNPYRDDEFSDYEDLQDILSEEYEREDWERYLMRMSPEDREEPSYRAPARRRENRDYEPDRFDRRPDFRPAPAGRNGRKQKKNSRAALAVLILALLLFGAGAYLYFNTDLYYVADIEMEKNRLSLFVGEQTSLDYEIKSFGSGEPKLEWTSQQPEIIAVDEQGGVSALSAGQTVILLTDPASGKQTRCEISVYNVDELVLETDSLTMGAGETYTLVVQTGTMTGETPGFLSADETVARVDENGMITAVGQGETDITVSCRGFNDNMCRVSVKAAPTLMETSVSGNMCNGETRALDVTLGEGEQALDYQYSSDAPSVVSVDENGVMTAVGEGSANVTVTVYNGVSCTLPVTVGKETSSVTVPQKLTVYSGAPVLLETKDNTGNCAQFFYESSDPETVSVAEDGTLTVLKRGKATITCTSYNGKSDKCEVTAKIVDYKTPYTSQKVYDNIAALAASHPDFISVESIGTSVQGRDITLLKMGTGQREVLVVAGMHSREGISVTFTMRCIDEYAQAMAAGKKYGRYNVTKMLSEYTIYFVPLLNPDGLDIFHGLEQPEYTDVPLTADELAEFKNTANGVNLNRNFPFEWGHEKVNTSTPDGRSYAGTSAGSEPETQAIMNLCAAHEFEWLLDMHCKGHVIYYQDKVTGEMKEATKLARRMFERCELVLTDQSNLWEISGGLENWFRKEYGKPGICVELVASQYSSLVNEHFELKTMWSKTKGIFLMCLED